ncbi:MAG: hypothetical protein MJ078_04250, partial [Clostridia bacterium]|nr:hypothetical protein [Clostridia bacterium]
NLFMQNGIDGGIDFSPIENIEKIEISIDDICGDLFGEISNHLPSNFFTELFVSKETMRAETERPIIAACNYLREKIDDICAGIKGDIQKGINQGRTVFVESIDDCFNQKEVYLASSREERKRLLENAKKELKEAHEKKVSVTELRRLFQHKLPQEIWL